MDQSKASLAALTRSAIHLVARIEALEAMLVQKGIATTQEIEEAIAQAERRLAPLARGIRQPNENEFDSVLEEILKRLQIRRKDHPSR